MGNNQSKTKRIAKNTGMLYFRMLLLMAISLYTSRVILRVLGVEDFGIANVVGGIVTMMAFLNSALNTSTQRYLNYEMGKRDSNAMQKVFCVSFWAYAIIALIAVIVAETVGLWFLNTQLTIPAERLDAAQWVFHLSVATFMVNLLIVPFNATIIAHEQMSIYAFVSIFEAILRLALVFLISYLSYDKLFLYGFFHLIVSLSVSLIYVTICRRRFQECRLTFVWDSKLFKGLFSFSGWMLAGTISNLFSTQGVNMIINIFFNPAMNAARGIAVQVQSAISSFSRSFMTAVRPQIVKSYAEGDSQYMYKLVFSASRASFLLLMVMAVPIIYNAEGVLTIWLGNVPDYAVLFTQLVLIDLLINAAYTPIAFVNQAHGDVRNYQLMISVCFLFIAVFTYIAYMAGMPVETTFYISIIVDIIGLFARLFILKRQVSFPVGKFLLRVILPAVCVFVCSSAIAFMIKWSLKPDGLIVTFESLILAVLTTLALTWMIGITKQEKLIIKEYIVRIIKR